MQIGVMSYNIRCLASEDGTPHTWAERLPELIKVIKDKNPDFIGIQEAVPQQMSDLEANLSDYQWIGEGRDGGEKGERSAIFFRKAAFEVIDTATYWLSENPEEPGSKGWGSSCPRIVSWGKFRSLDNGEELYILNTHFDHIASKAREKAAALLGERSDLSEGLPMVLTGDFNANHESTPFQILKESGYLNLWETAAERKNDTLGTFNNFHDPTGGGKESRIDGILTKGEVTARFIEVVNTRNGDQFPSDHYPLYAVLEAGGNA
ncbi:mRNA deadenylase, exonuclease subunit [Oceanobacillus picturae]|uniref:mRNA deadenylase, exonuclease subunit n=1 Tax=Oceanobacillus picturae TaxID=171693 RepID=A0A0U9HZY0_9BACI|nr:endonuclease/exonuclease/phosphatase family protein [Oceanobacillus picturae]GAQ18301.1 mRNA deadenylase, exonuclease subunit [Oceanobacillus picturae]